MKNKWAFSLLVVIVCVAAPSDLLAWNGSGHKTIASILFRRLSDDRRQEFAELLRGHPRYREDFAAAMPPSVRDGDRDVQAEWLLQQASVWPDIVRSGPPEREAYHRPLWHYLPRAFYLAEPTAAFRSMVESNLNSRLDPVGGTNNHELNGPQAFQANLNVLNDTSVATSARAVALCWVLHIGQDLHQPCHTASLYVPGVFADGDRGANNIRTSDQRNLHAVWDSPLGPEERYETCRNRAIAMLGDAPAEALNQSAGTAQVFVQQCLAEGLVLERDAVYVGDVRIAVNSGMSRIVVTLSPEYLRNVHRVSVSRMLNAGVRLGGLLQPLAN